MAIPSWFLMDIGFLKRLQVKAFSLGQCFCDSCTLNAYTVPSGTSPMGLGTLPCSETS